VQHPILGNRSDGLLVRFDQPTAGQVAQSLLHGALGDSDGFGYLLMTGVDRGTPVSLGLGPQMQIYQEGRRRAIVTHEIAHQDVEDVIVDRYHYSYYRNQYCCDQYGIDGLRFGRYARCMIKAIKFTSVPVSDQDRALAFYTQKLGFRILTDQQMNEKQRWIELQIPGAETGVVLFTPEGHENRIGTFSGISFWCDDVQRTYEELLARGVEFKGPPAKQPWGTFVIFMDPDGNQFVMSAR